MKRMEPLAEENKKLREALNLSEKSIKRAQREQDLTESNSWDLEHQKGVLSEQLVATTEQLQRKSDQLAVASEQLQKKTEQLAVASEQLKNASDQLEKKNQQLKSLTDQNTGMIIGEYTLYLFEQPSFG